MSIRTSPWTHGIPCWMDVSASDIDAAKLFYAGIFGWSYSDQGEQFGGYHIADRDGHATAGVAPLMEGSAPAWTVYIATDDIDTTAKAVTENGGTVVAGPMDINDAGRMLIALDPAGLPFGAWQAGTMIGSSLVNEPGGMAWEQLVSPDPAAAQAFYGAVFGWSFEALPDMGEDFVVFKGSEPMPLGGLSGPSGDLPSGWGPAIAVQDADAAVAFATSNNGAVITPAHDTPYGRMAVLADPGGAVFSISSISRPELMPDRSG